MERLTKAHYNGNGYYMACSEECHSPADCIDCAALDKLVARLAAYEDTGLAPKEIMSQEKWAVDLGKKMAEEFIAEIEKQCKEIYGVSSNRLFEILRAEADGRLVVLP